MLLLASLYTNPSDPFVFHHQIHIGAYFLSYVYSSNFIYIKTAKKESHSWMTAITYCTQSAGFLQVADSVQARKFCCYIKCKVYVRPVGNEYWSHNCNLYSLAPLGWDFTPHSCDISLSPASVWCICFVIFCISPKVSLVFNYLEFWSWFCVCVTSLTINVCFRQFTKGWCQSA